MLLPDEILKVEALHKSYDGEMALAGVDLEIGRGEVLALLGPNGAGKTTLVSIVAGLRHPDSGRVRVDGVEVFAEPDRARRRIGLAPQETGVYPVLSVSENLRFFGALGGLRGTALRRRIGEVADAFELASKLDRQARTLSGGEARRLHTAMSLMHKPPLLLLDEPTTGVDVRTRSRLLEVVRELAGEHSAICYSTHYLGEVEALNASVAILDQGRIVARDSLACLIATHGQSAVELQFEGPPPPQTRAGATVTGSTVRVATNGPPAQEAGSILARLGGASARVRAIDLVEPNLESVYLTLTGRPFATEPAGAVGEIGAA